MHASLRKSRLAPFPEKVVWPLSPMSIEHNNKQWVLIWTLLLVFALTEGCGWRRTMSFPSPSDNATVEIWQTRVDNSLGTRVELVTSQKRARVFENHVEAHVYFVHVYWSPDESKVAILSTGTNIWSLALDVRTGNEIPIDQLRDELAESIREYYRLPASEKDPIGWAATATAQQSFTRMHPEVRLSYQ
jgi:hypothetical protein